MTAPFDYFVVFAEMRTGSNFLESNLNAFDGVICHGEAFNPHFIGYPNSSDILGISQDQREDNPTQLVAAIRDQQDALGGFRYFHDHDPRVLDALLDDPRCAKIILTRNPLDSYVSWKIAKATGQWKLTNVAKRKEALAEFDTAEFDRHLQDLQNFQVMLMNRLQTSGQTAFYVAYEDLQDVAVMNGLARWMGLSQQLDELDSKLKRQNPEPVTAKVSNVEVMTQALAGVDRFNLTRTPNFEPRRGPSVPSYVVGAQTPLLFMPVSGSLDHLIVQWMAALDDVGAEQLGCRLNQKQLRQWRRRHPQHRSFTVVRHPLERAHAVFCEKILATGPGSLSQIRAALRKRFKLPIPAEGDLADYDLGQHRAAFGGFLDFLKANLAGQTSIRVDVAWASQAQTIAGFADLAQPDMVLRAEDLATDLPWLASKVGCNSPMPPLVPPTDQSFALDQIYDADLEAQCAKIYQRDYLVYGFKTWI